ncbi:MAG: 50S ribosomal protein L3 [Planctomycetota bacterium]
MSLDTLLGKKVGMSQIWDDDGNVIPVTIIKAGPCQVVQVKSKDGKDGYDAIQLGFESLPARKGGAGDPRANKPMRGHFARHSAEPHRRVQEVRLTLQKGQAAPEAGAVLKVDAVFAGVAEVDVSGTTKGRGFQGTVKRHGFARGPVTHGSKNTREPGSVSAEHRVVIRGKKMPGHMGDVARTVRNLRVVKLEPEHDLIYVKGAVPGPNGGAVTIRKAKSPRS